MSVSVTSASFSKHCVLHGSYFRELMVIFWLWPPDEKNWLTGKDPGAGNFFSHMLGKIEGRRRGG